MARNNNQKSFRGTGFYFGVVVVLVALVAIVVLAAQNTQPVTVEFLQYELRYPLIAVLLATIGGTIVVDELVGFIWRRRRRSVLRDRAALKEYRDQADDEAKAAKQQAEEEARAAKQAAKDEKAAAKAAKKGGALPAAKPEELEAPSGEVNPIDHPEVDDLPVGK